MKKKIIVVIGISALCLAGLLVFKIIEKHKKNQAATIRRKTLPAFQFYNQNLQQFNAGQLKVGIPVCIFYYNAECDHCQYEATEIKKHIEAFKNIQVIMVSTNTPKETLQFINHYQLKDYAFITWLYDKDYVFYKWFGRSVTPSVYIYDEQHKLQKEYTGEVKIAAVLKYLNDDN
jgi:peroxiredoxin